VRPNDQAASHTKILTVPAMNHFAILYGDRFTREA
jgi:hypothetical protein